MGMRSRWRDFLFVGVIALLVRLTIVLLVPAGHPDDMRGWMETTKYLVDGGLSSIYAQNLQGNAYPPAFFYPLWLVGYTYKLCCSSHFEYPTRTLDILMRLGPALADAAIAALICRLACNWTTRGRALVAGLVYAVNPAVLTTAAWMSMVGDPYYVLLLLLSLSLVASKRFASAAFFATVAVLTKPQALAFLPLIVFWITMQAARREIIASVVFGSAAGFGILLPFLLAGNGHQVMSAIVRMGNLFPYLHVRADNLWFILSGAKDPWGTFPPYDTNLFLGLLSYRDIGLVIFSTLNIWVFYWLLGRFTSVNLFVSSSLIGLGFFVLSTRMHVNYSFPVFALLSVLLPIDRRYWAVLVAITITCLIDWNILGPITGSTSFHLINAAAYVLAFVVLLFVVRVQVAGQSRGLSSQEAARLTMSRWPMLLAGAGLAIGAIVVWLLNLDIPVLSAGRSSLLFGIVALFVAFSLDRFVLANLKAGPFDVSKR